MYKLTNSGAIENLTDGSFIPMDFANIDCQYYLQWVAEGNTPLPHEPVPKKYPKFYGNDKLNMILTKCAASLVQVS